MARTQTILAMFRTKRDASTSEGLDFMCDSFTDNRKFRLLNVIDDFNRESLAIEADSFFTFS